MPDVCDENCYISFFSLGVLRNSSLKCLQDEDFLKNIVKFQS